MAALAILLLLFALPAQSQSMGFALLGLDAVRAGGGGGGPLGTLPTPSAAYSFRKLVPAYAGSSVRLLRASDSAQQDIGFVASDFNTAAATTFCNATTCTVAKWYDQSGNARDLTPSGAPPFTFSCISTMPCMRITGSGMALDGPSVTPATGVVSFTAVTRRFSGTGACQVLNEASGGNNRLAYGGAGLLALIGGVSGTISASQTDAQWHSAQAAMNGAGSYLVVDGTTTTGTTVGSASAGTIRISGAATTSCDSVEAAFWDNYVMTAAEAAALNSNQRAYWGF